MKTVIAGSIPNQVNAGRDDAPGGILAVTEKQRVHSSFELKVDPHSLTVIRIPGK